MGRAATSGLGATALIVHVLMAPAAGSCPWVGPERVRCAITGTFAALLASSAVAQAAETPFIYSAVGPEEGVARIFADARRAPPEKVDLSDAQGLRRYFENLFGGTFRQALEDAGVWEVHGAIALHGPAGLSIEIDGTMIDTTGLVSCRARSRSASASSPRSKRTRTARSGCSYRGPASSRAPVRAIDRCDPHPRDGDRSRRPRLNRRDVRALH